MWIQGEIGMVEEGRSFSCPNCGGVVPYGAKACPDCGSDEKTGWSEQTYLDGIGLYDDEDYRETLRKEFGISTKGRRRREWLWVLFAGILVLIFLFRIFLSGR